MIMPPKTRPRSKRIRPQVVQQPPQLLFGSISNDATHAQSGSSLPRMGFTPQNAATVQPVVNEWDTTTSRAIGGIPSIEDNSTNMEAEPTVLNKKKRVRGPTSMPKIWGQSPDELVAVSFNDLGQPNDENKTCTLAHFLGTIARNGRYCPLHYKDWRLMPNSYKEEMLKTVKTKFDLPPGRESYILKSINKKWRNWKSSVKSLNFDPDTPIEEQMLNVPDRVDDDQYRTLIEHWMSDKSKEISEKNKKLVHN